MGPRRNTISSSTASAVSDTPNPLTGSALITQEGCEHQEFNQAIEVIHGTGSDEGTVAIKIGECYVNFTSAAKLAALLKTPAASLAAGATLHIAG